MPCPEGLCGRFIAGGAAGGVGGGAEDTCSTVLFASLRLYICAFTHCVHEDMQGAVLDAVPAVRGSPAIHLLVRPVQGCS
eukprot:365690-Chlamydomonas_euryale.AAC.5